MVDGVGELDPYTVIHIVGLTEAHRHEQFVAQFLRGPTDPMLTRIAAVVISSHLGLSSKYRDDLLAVAQGVEWDPENDARLVALSNGWRLVEEGDHALRELLVDTVDDDAEDPLVRQTALTALCRAYGFERDRFPPATALWDPDGPEFRELWSDVRRAMEARGP